MRELIRIVGLINFIFLGLAFLNFFLKYFNRKIILKLPQSKADFANKYRSFMRFMIINHRWFGITGAVSVIIHFISSYINDTLLSSGILAVLVLTVQISLGLYGYYIKQGIGTWLKVHRVNGFILFGFIINHIVDIIQNYAGDVKGW